MAHSITYRELLVELNQLSEEELNEDAIIHDLMLGQDVHHVDTFYHSNGPNDVQRPAICVYI